MLEKALSSSFRVDACSTSPPASDLRSESDECVAGDVDCARGAACPPCMPALTTTAALPAPLDADVSDPARAGVPCQVSTVSMGTRLMRASE